MKISRVFNVPGIAHAVSGLRFFEAIKIGHEKLTPIIFAINPDHSDFKAAGGKMIMWHG